MAIIIFTSYDQASDFLQSQSQTTVDQIFNTLFTGKFGSGRLKSNYQTLLPTLYTAYGTALTNDIVNALIVFNGEQIVPNIGGTEVGGGTTNVGDGTTATSGKIFTSFDSSDIIKNSTRKITEAVWSTELGTLTNFYTSSTQYKSDYYKSVYHLNPDEDDTALIQFDVSYGRVHGDDGTIIDSGSSKGLTKTKTIYYQYSNFLGNTTFVSSSPVYGDFYVVDFSRNRVKQNLDPGNWELTLSGSGIVRTFIDNSTETTDILQTEGGIRYNIVSGSLQNGIANSNVYGYMFPEHSLLLFGRNNSPLYSTGFELLLNSDSFFKLIKDGGSFKARNEQKVNSTYYFCRIKNTEYNFSNNPSFTTGTLGDFRYTEMINNPTVYFTSIGLYNNQNELLAVAKISKPIQKTFQKEANIKIRLDW